MHRVLVNHIPDGLCWKCCWQDGGRRWPPSGKGGGPMGPAGGTPAADPAEPECSTPRTSVEPTAETSGCRYWGSGSSPQGPSLHSTGRRSLP